MSETANPFIEASKQKLLEQIEIEVRQCPDVRFPILLDLESSMCLVAQLQLALRHPSNSGNSADVARTIIEGIIDGFHQAGLHACAELARLGGDLDYDDPVPQQRRENLVVLG